MQTFDYIIQDPLGIHARPAGQLVKEAAKFEAAITIKNGEKSADAKRLFALMGLAVKNGNTITVTVDGPDEADAAKGMQEFLQNNL